MKIEVSDGEVVDKYSILCLKLVRIPDTPKRKDIQREKDLLLDYAAVLIARWPLYYDLLYHVNQQIWDKTDEAKSLSVPNAAFAHLTHEIFSLNDQRFRLKRVFNTNSHVKEQKSYADRVLHVCITSHDALMEKLDELIAMVLVYDRVHLTVGVAAADAVRDTVLRWLPPYFVSFLPHDGPLQDIQSLEVADVAVLSLISQHRRPVGPTGPDA